VCFVIRKALPAGGLVNVGSVALLGFPTDANSAYRRGAKKAPPLIRAELFSEAANMFSESVLDLKAAGVLEDVGDVELREDESDLAAVETAVGELLRRGLRVQSLGGDQSVTYPILRAFARWFPDLSVVHLDARPDLYPSFEGNHYSNACTFSRVLEAMPVKKLVQVGIRTMSRKQQEVVDRYGVSLFYAWEFERAYSVLPAGPVYVSVDVNALDPAFAPGVSHREPGGLSVRDALGILKAIPGTIVGADVVEYNPDQDVDGLTASVAATFTREFIARMAQERT
jgi:arginase